MDFSLLLSSYATVWSNPEVLLMTFIGALGGILLGAIPGIVECDLRPYVRRSDRVIKHIGLHGHDLSLNIHKG